MKVLCTRILSKTDNRPDDPRSKIAQNKTQQNPCTSTRRDLLFAVATVATLPGLATPPQSTAAPLASDDTTTASFTSCTGTSRTVDASYCRNLYDSCLAASGQDAALFGEQVEGLYRREYAYFVLNIEQKGDAQRMSVDGRLGSLLADGGTARECELLVYACYKVLFEQGSSKETFQTVGRELLRRVAPDVVEDAQELSRIRNADERVRGLRPIVQSALARLCTLGFACGYDIDWGSLPQLARENDLTAASTRTPSAASATSVQHPPQMQFAMLALAEEIGVDTAAAGDSSSSSGSSSSSIGSSSSSSSSSSGVSEPKTTVAATSGSAAGPPGPSGALGGGQEPVEGVGEVGGEGELVFQVRLHAPADLVAATALRAETEGFSGQLTGWMLHSLLSTAGIAQPAWDEYFLQDVWVPPRSIVDRILLFFGDPLMTVEVPWEPTTLVQDWVLKV